jgi:hypothetical protein
MNAHWQSDEMAYGLQDSGAKVLIADQERLDGVAACAPTCPVCRCWRCGRASRWPPACATCRLT